MKAKLTTNYIHVEPFRGFKKDYESHLQFKKWIEENKGNWVDIDTEFVFENQYNTVNGHRIFDTWIDEISDDVRTDKNIFFVKHPNGKDPIKKVDFKDHLKNERFMHCYSVNENYYRISRRSNIHFILAGNEIYISNGIGYTAIRKSRLSNNEMLIVKYCADRIINNKF